MTHKKTVIYCRVSTDDQVENYSLGTQSRICHEYLEKRGLKADLEFREDYTGAEVERPEMKKILDMAQQGELDTVVVADLDRFARGLAIQVQLEGVLEQNGVELITVLHEYEKTPEGMLQRNVRIIFAEFERQKYRQRSMNGRLSRAKSGFILPGSLSKFGYKYIPDRHQGRYEVNLEEAAVVKCIFEWYVNDKIHTIGIARRLTEMGVPTRRDTVGLEKQRKFGTWGTPP